MKYNIKTRDRETRERLTERLTDKGNYYGPHQGKPGFQNNNFSINLKYYSDSAFPTWNKWN